VLGTTDNEALDIRVNNKRVMRYEPNTVSPNLIGGHPANSVTGTITDGATIAGGGSPGPCFDPEKTVTSPCPNRAGVFAAVGGGLNNVADGAGSVIPGGYGNRASSENSTVGGGMLNLALGRNSVVAGGQQNIASGGWSTVVGGEYNQALGSFSVVMGYRAVATEAAIGSFVFSDTSYNTADFGSSQPNEFLVAATGGIGMWTQKDYNTGCKIPAGSGTWSCSSSKFVKRDFELVDAEDVLARVVALPITTWSYRQETGARHVGPTAQDFWSAFGLGSNDGSIATVDADGIALAAIQGLNAKLEAERAAKDAEIAALRAELAAIRLALATIAPRSTQTAEVTP
jgi:hypothetical protein